MSSSSDEENLPNFKVSFEQNGSVLSSEDVNQYRLNTTRVENVELLCPEANISGWIENPRVESENSIVSDISSGESANGDPIDQDDRSRSPASIPDENEGI